MTPRFNAFMPFIYKWEGTTYEDDPSDPGGATKYGIDQRSHPNIDIKNLTLQQANTIYFSEWQADNAETFSCPLGEVYFNACVNCGKGRADKLLVESANTTSDINQHAGDFLDYQDSFYRRLANSRPESQKFLQGWLNRTSDLRKTLGIT